MARLIDIAPVKNEVKPKIKGWVARDKDGELNWFEVEPRRFDTTWWDRDYAAIELDSTALPDLKWEDEPIEVELIIREIK